MPDHDPSRAADRNLLFGILALQMDFVSRDALVGALQAWLGDKSKPLGQILLNQGQLTPARRQLLEALVQEHLQAHGDDPQQSLTVIPYVDPIHPPLPDLGDVELRASLALLGSARAGVLATVADPARAAAGVPGAALREPRYRIVRPHAKGGLGEVFVGEDLELHRQVALKEIRPDYAHDPDSRGRFLLEAEITGNLEHPGVVPVYGLGTYADGRPFYAMRFVKGESLKDASERFHAADDPTRDASERSLALRQLLGQFIAVCNTVAYAHSRGVLHRDLKPANILLGPYGETLVVDWGLAKPVGQPEVPGAGTETTAAFHQRGGVATTREGAVLGTPAYMSPEQAAGHWDVVGPASDLYSLGATLYTLLTDQVPVAGAGQLEMLRKVKQGEVVPPRQVKPAVPRALEAVCLKALALRPEDRYPTALTLAADVEHWLADEPVSAYREPLPVRLRRWGRRHRPLVAAAAALLVTAVAALLVSTYVVSQQQRATEAARQQAVQERDRANANFALAQRAVEQTITRVAQEERLKRADFHGLRRDLLASAVPFYEEFVQQPGADAQLEAERGRTYWRLGYVRDEMGEKEQAIEAYEQMRAIFARLAGDFPAVPQHRHELALSLNQLGGLLKDLGKLGEAESAYRDAMGLHERLIADFPAVPQYRYGLAGSHTNLGVVLEARGQRSEAEGVYRAAIELQRQLAADFPAVPQYRHHLAISYNSLGALLDDSDKRSEAEGAYRAAIELQRRLMDQIPAVPTYRQELARSLSNLSLLLEDLSKRSEALEACREAIQLRERLANDFPAVPEYRQHLGDSYKNLGNLLRDSNQLEASLAWYAKAIAALAPVVADEPRLVVARRLLRNAHSGRAEALTRLRRHHEVVKDLDRALELDDGTRGPLFRLHRALNLARAGEHARAAAEADALARPKDVAANTLYHLARVYALATAAVPEEGARAERYAGRAVELLATAREAGFFKERANVERLNKDPDFNPLRARADFKKILSALAEDAKGGTRARP